MKDRVILLGEQKRLKFILVGDSSVGKSSLFWKYIEGQFLTTRDQTITTIDFRMKNINYNNQLVKLYIWDTAGQQKYRSIIESYFKGCNGVVMVFDQTIQQSFDNLVKKWYPIVSTKAAGARLVLVGNKSDLPCVVNKQNVKKWADSNNISYFSSSAKNGTNVQQPFNKLIQLNMDKFQPSNEKPITLNKKQPKKKQICC